MIDVLMSTYNGEKYIEEQLDSIFNQSFKDVKVIIRDDGSNDSTLSILEKYKDKIQLIKGNNVGFNKSFFELLNYSKNEYFVFSDQDDVWLPNKLETLYKKIVNLDNTKPLLVFSDMMVVDENLNVLHESFIKLMHLNPHANSFFELLKGNVVSGCSLMGNSKLRDIIRYSDINNVGIYDYYIALVASYFGDIVYVDDKLNYYRQHGKNTIGSRDFKWWINRLVHYTFKDLKSYINYRINKNKNYLLLEFYNNYKSEVDEEDLKRIIDILNKGKLLSK